MSFGISIGDFVLLTQLASNVVQNARKACGAHDGLTREVTCLKVALQRLETETEKSQSVLNSAEYDWKDELASLIQGCEVVLRMLSKILEKYNALSAEKRSVTKLWQKVRFGNGEMQNLSTIRQELVTYTTAITIFINSLSLGSQGKIEEYMDAQGGELRRMRQSLNWITASLQATAGGREGSLLTSYTDDDKAIWKDFRRGLINEGYSSNFIKEHKETILDYIYELGDRGTLDEPTRDRHSDATRLPFHSEGTLEYDVSLQGMSSSVSAQMPLDDYATKAEYNTSDEKGPRSSLSIRSSSETERHSDSQSQVPLQINLGSKKGSAGLSGSGNNRHREEKSVDSTPCRISSPEDKDGSDLSDSDSDHPRNTERILIPTELSNLKAELHRTELELNDIRRIISQDTKPDTLISSLLYKFVRQFSSSGRHDHQLVARHYQDIHRRRARIKRRIEQLQLRPFNGSAAHSGWSETNSSSISPVGRAQHSGAGGQACDTSHSHAENLSHKVKSNQDYEQVLLERDHLLQQMKNDESYEAFDLGALTVTKVRSTFFKNLLRYENPFSALSDEQEQPCEDYFIVVEEIWVELVQCYSAQNRKLPNRAEFDAGVESLNQIQSLVFRSVFSDLEKAACLGTRFDEGTITRRSIRKQLGDIEKKSVAQDHFEIRKRQFHRLFLLYVLVSTYELPSPIEAGVDV